MLSTKVALLIKQAKTDNGLMAAVLAYDSPKAETILVTKQSFLAPYLKDALVLASKNINSYAQHLIKSKPGPLTLSAGHRIETEWVPVDSAALYVPYGYVSTALMGLVAMSAAEVKNIVIATPPGPLGIPDSNIVALAQEYGATVYAMGGAHAIGALAYGTETIKPVDMIVGPGGPYVQEAKRQVFGKVGIDCLAGPTELAIVFAPWPYGTLEQASQVVRDAKAQLEHTAGKVTVFASELDTRALNGYGLPDEVEICSSVNWVDEINKKGYEHVLLIGPDIVSKAEDVRNAGAVFIGSTSAPAFGDYVAGTNHVLPTGQATKFSSGLSPLTFLKQVSHLDMRTWQDQGSAANQLADAGAIIARSERFEAHAQSMLARKRGTMYEDNTSDPISCPFKDPRERAVTEIDAMAALDEHLSQLDPTERNRVLAWAQSKWCSRGI